jgi:PilZ domain
MKTQHDAEYRRLEERKPVDLPAQVDSQGVKCLAVIQDISRSGGRLLVNRMFAVGTDIEVTLANGIKRRGVVRRCLPIDGSRKFEIGFEVIEASWPESLVSPDDEYR